MRPRKYTNVATATVALVTPAMAIAGMATLYNVQNAALKALLRHPNRVTES